MTNSALISVKRKRQASATRSDLRFDNDSARILRRVRQLMVERHISVRELATRLGMNRVTVYQHFSPAKYGLGPLRITMVREFANALNVPLVELLSVLPDLKPHLKNHR